MKFDRKKFFDAYRRHFPLSSLQVEGLERLLWGYETYYGWWDNVPQIANSLAQIKLETAHSFHPVVEGYYLGDPKAPNYYTGNTDRVRRFQAHLRYFPHFGRGDIQLTWLENYRLLGDLVRKYFSEIVAEVEMRTGTTFDLVKHPEQALDGRISFCVMTIGMHKGTFRNGHTLDRYINAGGADHFNARDIVNGDKNYKNQQGEKIGDMVALDAHKFENILNASLVEADADQILDLSETEADGPSAVQVAVGPAIPEPASEEPADPALVLPGDAATNDPSKPTDPAQPPPTDGFTPAKFTAFVPQIDTAKRWIKVIGTGGTIGTAASVAAGLPLWIQIALASLVMVVVIGTVVMFIKYHNEIFAYITAMNTLRADSSMHDPEISAETPKG